MINKIKEMYKQQGISEQVYDFSEKICADLEERFKKVDKIAEYNQLKVIGAMQKNKVAEAHFNTTTGYGYNDLGRETLEKVYADVFHTEDALVRPQITCGTHALALALSANLRPNDKLVYISGKPYDTLEEVIGIRPSNGSLAEYGVKYDQVDLLENGEFDFEGIKEKITNDVKVALFTAPTTFAMGLCMPQDELASNCLYIISGCAIVYTAATLYSHNKEKQKRFTLR